MSNWLFAGPRLDYHQKASSLTGWEIKIFSLQMYTGRTHLEVYARTFCSACFVAFLALGVPLNGQSRLQKLKKSDLIKIEGTVPTYYPQGYETMARRDQVSLEGEVRWVQEQLRLRRPTQLLLLDEQHWHTFTGFPYPFAGSDGRQALIMVPVDLGNLGSGIEGSDEMKRDLTLFHEAGHIYADAAKLENINDALTDLYADLFATSYIRAKRPDLSAVLRITPSTNHKPLRFSRFDDWNLLSDDLDVKNVDWFEVQLLRIASFVTSTHQLRDIVPMLQKDFPENEIVMSEQLAERFEAMVPGFRNAAGDLLLPPSLPQARIGPCQGKGLSAGDIPVVFLNRSKQEIRVGGLNGESLAVKRGWQKLHANKGQEIRLTDALCALVADGPTLVNLADAKANSK